MSVIQNCFFVRKKLSDMYKVLENLNNTLGDHQRYVLELLGKGKK